MLSSGVHFNRAGIDARKTGAITGTRSMPPLRNDVTALVFCSLPNLLHSSTWIESPTFSAVVLFLVANATIEAAAQANAVSQQSVRDLNGQATEVVWQTKSKRLKGKGAATS